MNNDILVVGGYGTIGRMLCTLLTKWVPGGVVVAGRSKAKAERFASTQDKLRPVCIDAGDPSTFDAALDQVDTAVMCLDANTPAVAEVCFRRGINYVDLSPTDANLRQVEALEGAARANGATGLLSVGLAPGMTNLLVRDAVEDLDAARRADITLLLGVGDAFGPDTIQWTVDTALQPFTIEEDHRRRRVKPFSAPRVVNLPSWGRHRAYRVNLADQHILQRTLDVPAVATRLCYGSRLITTEIAVLIRLGLFQPLASALGPARIAVMANALPFGTDEFVIHTVVRGTRNGQPVTLTRWLRGTNQARATAHVASVAVRRLHHRSVDAGAYHLHELFPTQPFMHALRTVGIGREQQIDTGSTMCGSSIGDGVPSSITRSTQR